MRLLSLILFFNFIFYSSFSVSNENNIKLGLDWFINPDHAPIIIAEQYGYFKENGLKVEIIEPADPNDPPKQVAAGKIDIAISYQPQFHLQIDQSLPIVRLGSLVSTPLNSLVVLKDGPIKSIKDLKNKKIGFSVGGFEDALLSGMFEKYGLRLSDVQLININFSLSPSLISKKVDAVIGAFRNFELNQMDIVNRPGKAFYPEEHGVPHYEELIYIINKNDRKKQKFNNFLKAIQKATIKIVNSPSETWKDFSSYKKGLNDELNKRAYRDTVRRFTLRPSAYDLEAYKVFQNFLYNKKIIKKMHNIELFIKPWLYSLIMINSKSIALFLFLLGFWLLMSGHYTVLITSLGVISCLLCVYLTIKGNFLDNETIPIYFFPRLIQYTIWLIKEIFISNITTAKVILSKSEEPELFSVKATQKTNEGKVTYANSITLTPGTVTTQIKDNVFEVHALTKEFGDDVRGSEMDRMVTWLEKGK